MAQAGHYKDSDVSDQRYTSKRVSRGRNSLIVVPNATTMRGLF